MTQPWLFPQPPYSNSGYGNRTPWGMFLPPGGKVQAFVSSSTPTAFSGDEQLLASGVPIYTTLAAALALCRPAKGDMVICLPGHTENVVDATMLNALVSGTRIIGIGSGALTPTFTWTAAAGQWVLNDNDVTVAGLRLNLGGFNGVTNAIAWTGADVLLAECEIIMGTSAALKAVVGITVGVGGDRGRIAGCDFRGAVAAAVVNGILISGIVDRFRITDCDMDFATTVGTVGNIAITAAITAFIAKRCIIRNSLGTTSTATITAGAQASTGMCTEVYSATTTTGAGGATRGIIINAASFINCMECYHTGNTGTNGVLSPVVTT